MHLLQAVLISVWAGLAGLASFAIGPIPLDRPIISGLVVGAVLGDVGTGLVVGGTLELIWLGVTAIGGATPPNIVIGAILGAAFAIMTGQEAAAAVAVAIPASLIFQAVSIVVVTAYAGIIHRADRYAERASVAGVSAMHLLAVPVTFVLSFVVVFASLYLGLGRAASAGVDTGAAPPALLTGLIISAGILPALGLAMILRVLLRPKYIPYFILGFIAVAYLKLSIIGVALVGSALALIFVERGEVSPAARPPRDERADATGRTGRLSRKELVGLFWRSLFLQASFNFERMQALGFAYAIGPILGRFYPGREERAEALKRHLEFFNTNPEMSNIVFGVVAAMEEAREDPEAIRGIKAAMMGPLAGIGDSVFLLTYIPVTAALGASLALQRNILGPAMLLLYIVPVLVFRYYLTRTAYHRGLAFLEEAQAGRLTEKITDAATIVGVTVIAGLTATVVKAVTPLTARIGETAVQIQPILDQILPSFLPLSLVLGSLWILRRGWSATKVLIALLVLAIASAYLGLLAAPAL